MENATEHSATDIERIMADAIRMMTERGDVVLNAVDGGICCLDGAGRTIFVNEAATRMLGYTMREMIGRTQHEMVHHHYADGSEFPMDACPIWHSVTDGIHQKVGGDTFWKKDGTPLPVDYTSIPIKSGKKIVAVVVTFYDATTEQRARAQAEKLAAERAAREEAERGRSALLEAEERSRLALEAGQMGTWEWDMVENRVIWSPQEERMYGLAEGTFSGKVEDYQEFIHPDDRASSFAGLKQALESGAPTYHVLHRIVRPDGETRWLDSHARFLFNDEGKPVRLTGVSTDVTERQVAAEELRLRDERFHALIKATRQIVWTNSADGRMEGEQPGWGEFTGQTYEEYREFGWANAVHPDDAQPTVNEWNASVRDRRMFVFEHRVKRHDGVYRNFAIRAIPLLNADGTIREWVGSHTDITDQRESQAILDRALAEAEAARTDLVRIFDQAPAAIATFEGPTHVIRSANPRYRELLGNRELLGRTVREALPEVDQALIDLLDNVYRTGEPFVGERVEVAIDRGRGKIEPGVFNFVYQPIRKGDGSVSGIMVHAIEVGKE